MLGTEEEKIRQLTRELHEAAQDARAAAKELDAAQRRYAGSITKHYKKAISEADLQFKTAVQEGFQIVSAQVRERFADLIDASSPDQVLEAVIEGVRADISQAVNRAAGAALRKIMISELPSLIRREIKDDRLRSLIIEEFHSQVELMIGPPIGGTASALPPMRGSMPIAVQNNSGKSKHTGRRR